MTTTLGIVLLAVTTAYTADLYWHRHRNTPRSHRLIKGVAVTATFPITGATLTMALAFLAIAHLAAAILIPGPWMTKQLARRNRDRTELTGPDEGHDRRPTTPAPDEQELRRQDAARRTAEARTRAAEARADAATATADAAEARAAAARAKADAAAEYAKLITPMTDDEIAAAYAAQTADHGDTPDTGTDQDERDAWLEARADEADKRNRRTIGGRRIGPGIVRNPDESF